MTAHRPTERSFLKRYPLRIADESDHIATLSAALAAFGESVRNAIDQASVYGDADTANLFTEVSRGADQQLWLVEFHMPRGG